MTVRDALEEFSNERLGDLASAIRTGAVDADRADRIRALLEDADLLLLDQVAQEKPALGDLVDAAGVDLPIQVDVDGELDDATAPLEPAARSAIERVEDLLEPGAGRDADFFAGLREALELGDAEFSGVVTQDTLDAIPPAERDRLAERADALVEGQVLSDATMTDFPQIRDLTDRGPGRTATRFRQILRELRGEADPDVLPADALDRLQRASDVRQSFIEKVQRNISALEGDDQPGAADRLGLPSDVGEAAISARVRRIVPDAERREDPLTGESFTADPALEQRFLSWVIDVRGDTDRFDTLYFRQAPANRDISMADWARLQVRAGNGTVEGAVNAGLPREWFADLDR